MTDIEKLQQKVEDSIEKEKGDPLSVDDFTHVDTSDHEKSRVWCMLLYPDNEVHAQVLKTVFSDFVAIGALHDQDIGKDGNKVKDHYHIVLYFTSPVRKATIRNQYPALEERFYHSRKDVKVQVRYLLHMDSPSKYQYPISYLEGNIERFGKYVDGEQYECSQVEQIIKIIKQTNGCDLADLILMFCDHNLYSTYRRNAYTFNLIYSQVNQNKKSDK